MESGAKNDFSKSNSCPLDRVEVRARTDIKPSDVMYKAPPPKDVAADPARLAMWQKQQNDNAQHDDSGYSMMEAKGCDKTSLLRCHRMKSGDVMCMSAKYPDGVAKW